MASFSVRQNSDGSTSYVASIRKKNIEIKRSFKTEEDANVFAFYKERLIDLMNAFEVPLSETLTIDQVFELKLKEISEVDIRPRNDFINTKKRITSHFNDKIFIKDITYNEWLECAKSIYQMPVFRGGKNESCKKNMSPKTLRNIFAYCSSAISNAQEKGIKIPNYPLEIIKDYIIKLEK